MKDDGKQAPSFWPLKIFDARALAIGFTGLALYAAERLEMAELGVPKLVSLSWVDVATLAIGNVIPISVTLLTLIAAFALVAVLLSIVGRLLYTNSAASTEYVRSWLASYCSRLVKGAKKHSDTLYQRWLQQQGRQRSDPTSSTPNGDLAHHASADAWEKLTRKRNYLRGVATQRGKLRKFRKRSFRKVVDLFFASGQSGWAPNAARAALVCFLASSVVFSNWLIAADYNQRIAQNWGNALQRAPEAIRPKPVNFATVCQAAGRASPTAVGASGETSLGFFGALAREEHAEQPHEVARGKAGWVERQLADAHSLLMGVAHLVYPVTRGRLVLKNGYPTASSHLEMNNVTSSFRSHQVYYIGDYGDWALVAPVTSKKWHEQRCNSDGELLGERVLVRRSEILEFTRSSQLPEWRPEEEKVVANLGEKPRGPPLSVPTPGGNVVSLEGILYEQLRSLSARLQGIETLSSVQRNADRIYRDQTQKRLYDLHAAQSDIETGFEWARRDIAGLESSLNRAGSERDALVRVLAGKADQQFALDQSNRLSETQRRLFRTYEILAKVTQWPDDLETRILDVLSRLDHHRHEGGGAAGITGNLATLVRTGIPTRVANIFHDFQGHPKFQNVEACWLNGDNVHYISFGNNRWNVDDGLSSADTIWLNDTLGVETNELAVAENIQSDADPADHTKIPEHFIFIRGGASSDGLADHNLALSERRADWVAEQIARELAGDYHVLPDDTSTAGELNLDRIVIVPYGAGEALGLSKKGDPVPPRSVEIMICSA